MRFARKALPVKHVKAIQGLDGTVEAYVSVFNNVDYVGERILPGFFADTIGESAKTQKPLPAVLWSHNVWDVPIGITTEAEEVLPYNAILPADIRQLGGLRVVGKFNMDVQLAREAFSSIVFGSLRKYSIGYYVLVDQYDRETGIVDLIKGDWVEWSPVNFAANDMTETVGAKGGPPELEVREHVMVLRKEAEFEDGSFRRMVREAADGKSYVVVTGKLRATGNTEEATIRFDTDAWSVGGARSVCADHNAKGTFKAGTNSSAVDGDEESGVERLADHGARVVAQVSAYVSRVEDVKSKRLAESKAGRVLSEANRTILAGLLPDLTSVIDRVQKLLDDTATSSDGGSGGGKSSSSSDVVLDEERKKDARKLQARMMAMQHELYAELDSERETVEVAS